jgi:CHAD domain-containing protein
MLCARRDCMPLDTTTRTPCLLGSGRNEVSFQRNHLNPRVEPEVVDDAPRRQVRNDSLMGPVGEDNGVARPLSAGELVRRILGRGVGDLVQNDPLTRGSGSSEAVHQLRVASRRLRAELRVFASVVHEKPLHHLLGELKWIGRALGKPRDLDVRGQLLSHVANEIPRWLRDDLNLKLDRERSEQMGHVIHMLESDRYRRLIADLADAVIRPPLNDYAGGPAQEVLATGLDDALHSLFERVEVSGKKPSNEQLHEIRILAKKARYSAAVAATLLGDRARNIALSLEEVQTLLGELHDRVVMNSYFEEEFDIIATSRPSLDLSKQQARIRRRLEDEIKDLKRRWRGPYGEARRHSAELFPVKAQLSK